MSAFARAYTRWESTWVDGPPDAPEVCHETALRRAAGLPCPDCGNEDTSAMRVEEEVDFNGYDIRCEAPDPGDPYDVCGGVVDRVDFGDREA